MNRTNLFRSLLMLMVSCLFSFQSGAQIFSGSKNKMIADSLISSMKEGVLIVPLITNSKRLETIQNLAGDSTLSVRERERITQRFEKEKRETDQFNEALIAKFQEKFNFCKILFIENSTLNGFDHDSKSFINPATMLHDPALRLKTKNFFFLRYYKTSGRASSPGEVRSFLIADSEFNVIPRPFPSSPGRGNTFKMRLQDLFNISPNTNELIETLVEKLNDALFRYHSR